MNARRFLPALMAIFTMGRLLTAQDPAPPSPAVPPTVSAPPPVVTPPDPAPVPTPPAVAVPPAPSKPPENTGVPVRERERTIYVPYTELQKVFTDGGKGVFLPYKEFLELWSELNLKRTEEETKPPQDGIVSRAEYTGKVEGDLLAVEAKITVESFKKGWLTIPLAKGGKLSAVGDAEAGKAVLSSKPDGYDVIVPDKGVYELELKFYAPVTKTGGKFSVPLGLPTAAVSRFTAVVPGKGWEFEVKPAAAFTSRPVGEDTALSFFFGNGTQFGVTWSKTEAATALAPLILAQTKVTSEVRGGSVATKAAVDLRILRAPVSELKFSVPAGQEILNVTGTDVKEWKLEAKGDRQLLIVSTNAPVKDKWNGTLALESPLPKLPADAVVPDVVMEGAVQDRGEIGVLAEPQLDVTPKPGEGLIQQTAAGAGAEGLVNVAAYRYLKHPAKLQVGVVPAVAQVDVESVSRFIVDRDRSKLVTEFAYNIRRVGLFEARVALPDGWSGWEVVGVPPEKWSVEKQAVTVNGAAVQKDHLVLRFDSQTLGNTKFTVQGQKLRTSPTEDLVVPTYFLSTPGYRYEAKIGVVVHTSLEATTKQIGDLRLEDVNVLNFKETTAENRELTLAFRHRDAVKTQATLGFKQRPPQVNVQVLTLAQIREQSTLHQWTLAFDVAYAAIDKFILAVPKAAAAELRLVDPLVKEVNKEYQPPAAAAGAAPLLPNLEAYALWEVTLRNERQGVFNITLNLEQPSAGGEAAKVELQQVHVPGVFQETGQVAVVKDDSLEIREPVAENLEEIDPKELSEQLQQTGVFLAFKYKTQPLSLKLDVARNAYIEVPQTVVTHAVLTTAVATDRAQTTEVIYWLKNNARQFLTVQLPKGAKLVSDVFVSTQSQRPMKREGSDDLLVRLPSGAAARNTAFPVRFVYEIPSPKAGEKMGWMGGISIVPPTLADVAVVLQTQQALYVPESHEYTKFKGPMTLSLKERGWGRFRGIVNSLVPAFGPQFTQSSGDWTPAPAIPSEHRSTFDFQVPTQGRNFVLHRLGVPAATDISYRSRGWSYFLETLVFFGVIVLGLRRWHHPLPDKLRFLVLFGLGGLLVTGLVSAANAQVAKGAVLAAILVAVLWVGCGIIQRIKARAQMLKKRLSPPVVVPPASNPTPAPVASAPATPSTVAASDTVAPELPKVEPPSQSGQGSSPENDGKSNS